MTFDITFCTQRGVIVRGLTDPAGRPFRRMQFAFPAGASMSSVLPACPGRDEDLRRNVLPPVQMDMESSDAAAELPPGGDDNSVPPIVRFKNRYRQAQQQQQQQWKQQCETQRDWNHNETSSKTCSVDVNCSPVEHHHMTNDTYCRSSPTKILPDLDAVRYNPNEKRTAMEEMRPCEKRRWSRIASEMDLEDLWKSSSKMTYHDTVVDSRRTDGDQPELMKRYHQAPHRSLEYQNCVVSYAEPACEQLYLLLLYFFIFLHRFVCINIIVTIV